MTFVRARVCVRARAISGGESVVLGEAGSRKNEREFPFLSDYTIFGHDEADTVAQVRKKAWRPR